MLVPGKKEFETPFTCYLFSDFKMASVALN